MSTHQRSHRRGGDDPSDVASVQPLPHASRRAASGPDAERTVAAGPFASEWLNAALSDAFGPAVARLRADVGEDGANRALGAVAHTRGARMSFGGSVREDADDADSLAVIGEEVAHALAGGGSGQTAIDVDGDPGEARAQSEGARFASWVRSGRRGPAPALRPATGGRAEVHRHAEAPTTWAGRPSLQEGARGDNVRQLQTLLNAHGAGVVVDGVFGPQTRGAVVAFQRARGLVVDGVAGPQTAGALRGPTAAAPAPAPSPAPSATVALSGSPPLKLGATGTAVRNLQTLLNQHGARLTVDGQFGAKTHDAVTAFQRANGLLVDGIVGPVTAGRLTSGQAQSITPAPAPTPAVGEGAAAGGASTRLTGEPALRKGSQGEPVKELQRRLNVFGGGLLVDGDFGNRTDAAVRGFQAANGLVVDGVVGRQTAPVLYTPSAKRIVAVPAPAGGNTAPGANADRKRNADPGGRLNDSRMNPTVVALTRRTIEDLQGQGLFPYVTDGFRSHESQNAAYEAGNSMVRAGGSWHNYGLAVDIAFWNEAGTGPSWNIPNYDDWYKLGRAGKAAGFTRWGGDFQSLVDMVHLEYHPNWSSGAAYGLMDLYNREGLQAVWDRAT